MTNESKTNYALIFTILVTLAGWGVTFGVCKNQIETNGRDNGEKSPFFFIFQLTQKRPKNDYKTKG